MRVSSVFALRSFGAVICSATLWLAPVALFPGSLRAGRYDTAHLSITAQALFDEYARNEFAADEKYKDRQINVGGILHKVGRDNDGRPYLTFRCSETTSSGAGTITTFGEVRCFFDAKDEHLLAKLQTERTCTAYGTVAGKKNREIMLKDCSL